MPMTDEIDFEERRLCPDGACIGVIGDDGRCKMCGRADDGSIVVPSAAMAFGSEDDVELDAVVRAEGSEAFGDDDRELCPDGACIGVIGSDGKCKECGRPRGT